MESTICSSCAIFVPYLSEKYKVTRFYLAGHSNGGMMANRVWCEAPELFDRYVAVAGPCGTACTPSQAKPYLGIAGSGTTCSRTRAHREIARLF